PFETRAMYVSSSGMLSGSMSLDPPPPSFEQPARARAAMAAMPRAVARFVNFFMRTPSSLLPVPIRRSGARGGVEGELGVAPVAQRVDEHGHEDHETRDDRLPLGLDRQDPQAVEQDRHDQRADERADDGSAPAQ